MNRNEFLEPLPITRIAVRLVSAALEVCTDDIDDIHVMVSGADNDVSNLRITVQGDQLTIEQSGVAKALHVASVSWLQVTLRLPRTWKGSIDGRTVSGWITTRSLTGADMTLESVSGMILATDLSFITLTLRSVTGSIKAACIACERCSLGSTSGDLTVENASLLRCSLMSITGNSSLALVSPFEEITASSVTGDVAISAPVSACDATLRSVSGQIHTSGASILPESPAKVRVNTVSGGLDITCTEAYE